MKKGKTLYPDFAEMCPFQNVNKATEENIHKKPPEKSLDVEIINSVPVRQKKVQELKTF